MALTSTQSQAAALSNPNPPLVDPKAAEITLNRTLILQLRLPPAHSTMPANILRPARAGQFASERESPTNRSQS